MKTICKLIVLAAITTNALAVLGNYKVPLSIPADITKHKAICDLVAPLYKEYNDMLNVTPKIITEDECSSIALVMARAYCMRGSVMECIYNPDTDTYNKDLQKPKRKWDTKIESWRNQCKIKCTMSNSKWSSCRNLLKQYTKTTSSRYPKCPKKPKNNLVDLYEAPLSMPADIAKYTVCNLVTPMYDSHDIRNLDKITEDLCEQMALVSGRSY